MRYKGISIILCRRGNKKMEIKKKNGVLAKYQVILASPMLQQENRPRAPTHVIFLWDTAAVKSVMQMPNYASNIVLWSYNTHVQRVSVAEFQPISSSLTMYG